MNTTNAPALETPRTIGDLFGSLSPSCWSGCERCGIQFMSTHDRAFQGRASHSLRCETCGPVAR